MEEGAEPQTSFPAARFYRPGWRYCPAEPAFRFVMHPGADPAGCYQGSMVKKDSISIRLIGIIILAILMFAPMFVMQHLGPFDFWWWMTTNLVVLLAICFLTDSEYLSLLRKDFSESFLRKTGFGLLSAFLL